MICPYQVGIVDPRTSGDRLFVGCNKCGACRHNRRIDWSFRIGQQAKESANVLFVTLTYDDGSLPLSENLLPTLESRYELSKFVKKLRRKQEEFTDTKFKYVYVGEYGTRWQRPHYHFIFFNIHTAFDDGVIFLQKWKKGVPHTVKVSDALIHYMTKYHVSSRNLRKLEEDDDREPEFFISSNGIGANYAIKARQWHLDNKATYVVNNGFKQRMPKYYKDKVFKDLSEEERAELNALSLEHMNKSESKELLRLSKLGYQNPEKELHYRNYYAAKSVMEKGKTGSIF